MMAGGMDGEMDGGMRGEAMMTTFKVGPGWSSPTAFQPLGESIASWF
jgi:hypothetical protein